MRNSALVLILALAGSAHAQWLSYGNDTATRLQLTQVTSSDNQEKDMAACDFNHDGWTDVVVVRKTPFSNPGAKVDVLLMNENGTLVDRTALYAPEFLANLTDARDVLCADFTGDGWEDVVICTTFNDTFEFYRNRGDDAGGNWLGLAREAWRFGPISTTSVLMCGVGAGDIDNDNDLDLYFANYNGGDDVLYVNDGTGVFTDQTVARVGNNAKVAFGTGVQMADFDFDGDTDILKISTLYFAGPFGIGVFLLWNDGTGKFNTIPFQELTPTSSPYMMMGGDLAGNGRYDFYIIQDPQDRVLVTSSVAQHHLTWTNKDVSGSRTSGFGGNVRMADLDRDGDLDMGIAPIDVDIANCGVGSQFCLLQNDSTGKLSDSQANANIHVDCHDFDFLDLNRDGCQDIFMGLCTGWRVFVQQNCDYCYADCEQDGDLDVFDFLCFQNFYGLGDWYADCEKDGDHDVFDFLCFQNSFGLGCP